MSVKLPAVLLALASVLSWGAAAAEAPRRVALDYAPAPVSNPLKGLVPYSAKGSDPFPHSLEFNYIPFSALVTGLEQYDWTPIETLLDAAAKFGHQAIFRVFLEYPGRTNVIPAFLIKGGLKVYDYVNTNTQPLVPVQVETPDYSNPDLRKVMTQFILALGKKYDGDTRIGFITAGLLGSWGEWHDYPRNDLFASKDVQTEVMDAYEAAFKTTPILVRLPTGQGETENAPNAGRRFGYHDDSFAWATLDTGRKGDEWFFMARMNAAGPEALNKWKTEPIGGEIRPEAWGKVFDADPGDKHIQDFGKCVEATHVTWLMDSGMFPWGTLKPTAERIKRAEEEVRRMGYEFHVPSVTISPVANETLPVKVEVENRGVAPFYYDWPVEFGLLGANGDVIKTFNSTDKLTGLLPGDPQRVWDDKLALKDVKAGTYKLALRVPNPVPKGLPVRFANKTQDQDAFGWLTLTSVTWR